ncbi:major facilitator superfamily domain-containing protein 6-like [Echeneis naucrates]|uniref:Major facilitator superfamily associated domain-containing protein n=1 Tax=Echeneis naucrates TaxID=173247 RepID=A0A665UPA5_ECHNA|nr:major facilitator superfamily domain-containing protein 6-like [Echeneis naucrates]
MRRNKQIDIKRALALASTLNFLCSCANACLLPFLTLYFRQLGLTPVMTGIIMGAKHLITLVWSPVASFLSKHYNKRRVVINGSLVCSAAVALLLLLIPHTDVRTQGVSCNISNLSSAPVQSTLTSNQTVSSFQPQTSPTTNHTKDLVSQPGVTFAAETLVYTKSPLVATSKPALDLKTDDKSLAHTGTLSQANISIVVNKSFSKPTISSSIFYPATSSSAVVVQKRSNLKNEEMQRRKTSEEGGQFDFLGRLKAMDPQHQLFFLVLIIVSVWEFVSAPLQWTADDGLYDYLDFADATDRYSSTGLWGLLGAACGVGGAGLLVSQLHCLIVDQTPRSAVHFYCYAGLATLALPAAACLPLYLNKKRNRANGFLKAMQLVQGSPRALLCAATTVLVSVAVSSVDNFLLWQMQDHGSNELHMGLSLSLGLLSQAAFPLLAARVSKLLSPGRLLVVGAATLGLQCLYYSFLWGPWAALVAQMLSCFSIGALWWAVKVQCKDVAIPGAEKSVRRVYSALTLHLGSGLGSIAGGFVVQRFGLTWQFRGVAVGLMVWCMCLLLLQWKAPRQRRINYSRLLTADASEASDSESEQERDWLDKAMEDDDGSNNNYAGWINH